MDFTSITAAVDATTVIAALTAIAAVKVGPRVAKWGYNTVMNWFPK